MRLPRLLLIAALVLFGAVSLSAQYTSVRLSHDGRVTSLVSDPQSGDLFSSGVDGTVRRWATSPAQLLAEYQISQNPITQIALHPDRPLLAALATDRQRTHILHIWDLERGEEVARRYLDEEPLLLQYSPTGRYLVYATPDFQSIRILDGSRATPLPYLRRATGLANYVLFSTSETTAVVYSPGSGIFRYLEVRGNDEIRTVQSLRNLEYLSVLTDRKRNAVAKRGDQLVVVDIYTGEQRDAVFMPGIQSISLEAASGTIAVVTREDDVMDFSSWRFTDGALSRRFLSLRDIDTSLSAITYHDGQIVTATDNGDIFQYSRFGGGRRLVAEYPLSRILDFEVDAGNLYLSLPGRIITIASDLFTERTTDRVSYVVTRSTTRDLSDSLGLEPLDTGEIVLWTNDGEHGAFTFLDNEDTLYDDFETPLIDLRAFPTAMLALERSGQLRGIDPITLETVFEYSAAGIQTMVVNDAYGIVAGKNAAGIIDTALIRIDPDTGETVGVETDPFLVYDLQIGEGDRELFSIGLETRAEATHTVVNRHSGENLERTNTIMLYPGEDLTAGLYVDPETHDVYTSAGFDGVRMWDGRRIRQYDAAHSIPRQVRGYGGFIYAINKDSTLSVWNKETGEVLLRLFVFRDGSWIAQSVAGYYVTSGGLAEAYLDLTDNPSSRQNVTDYRIEAPFTLP